MIRFAEEKDLENCLNLGEEFYKESPIYNTHPWEREKAKDFFYRILNNDWQCGIVAYDKNDELIGMVLGSVDECFYSNNKTLNEYIFYVRKDKRGGKTVFKLIDKWVEWGITKGAKDVWFIHSSGIGTDKFFKHIGFKQIGTVLRRM